MNNKMKRMLSVDYQLNATKKYKLKITLKNTKDKGVGIFATEQIHRDDIIAFYKLVVFDAENYKSPTDNIYTFSVYNRNGTVNDDLIGDIDDTSFHQPINNIPFWGPFVNEPSPKQSINACFNPNLKYNYKLYRRRGIKRGDSLIYSIFAIRDISVGEEINVYYGDEYERNYKVKVSDDDRRLCDYKNQKTLKLIV